jgi:hypothetical protein
MRENPFLLLVCVELIPPRVVKNHLIAGNLFGIYRTIIAPIPEAGASNTRGPRFYLTLAQSLT